MSNEQIDDETLAAFLDGGLTTDERDVVLRVLANSPEAYARFLEAASIAEALREDKPFQETAPIKEHEVLTPNVIPIPRHALRWRRIAKYSVPLLAAASVVGILLVSRGAGTAGDAVGIADMVAAMPNAGPGALDRNLGTGWDQPPWSVTRGITVQSFTDGLSARLGVRYAFLDGAAAMSDSVAFARNASILATLLSNVDGAGPLANRISAQQLRTPNDRRNIGSQLRSLVDDADAFDVGVWLGAARMLSRSTSSAQTLTSGKSLRVLQRGVDALSKAPNAERWGPTLRSLTRLLANARQGAASMATVDVRAQVDSALAAIPR